ncbi:RHS repeat-associated core domain-containing protein [Nitritalea halalkaliphila]|uniref:RHS repeat-associated core domain-containing protein n=1 Tax=Nitritalea halalkaliphila TaxID=590849 RepID=UPI00030B8CD0|nr:RHS repeat-associated core domain-containing protein [Nitritalea halalkaliphila]
MRYVLYDRDSVPVQEGRQLLSSSSRNKHEVLEDSVQVTSDGYLELYVLNETSQDAWFDDLTVSQSGPIIVQERHYYPFGMQLSGLRYDYQGHDNRYLYNRKELLDDLNLNLYDFGARYFDPVIGRWTSVDPLADVAPGWSPYRAFYCNPIRYTDPTGMLESTHTDEDGNVVAVYDDGNNGVYRHSGKGTKAEKSVKSNYNKNNTSAGGEKMGESLHSLSFADQNLYNKTGKVKQADIKIDFGSTELTDKVQGIIDANPSLVEYAGKAGTNGDWDLKSNTSNGSLLYGKYASPRDAGNFAAGAVAQMSGLEPIAQFGYGAYNMTGNSKPLTGLVTGVVGLTTLINPPLGLGAAYLIGKYG